MWYSGKVEYCGVSTLGWKQLDSVFGAIWTKVLCAHLFECALYFSVSLLWCLLWNEYSLWSCPKKELVCVSIVGYMSLAFMAILCHQLLRQCQYKVVSFNTLYVIVIYTWQCFLGHLHLQGCFERHCRFKTWIFFSQKCFGSIIFWYRDSKWYQSK